MTNEEYKYLLNKIENVERRLDNLLLDQIESRLERMEKKNDKKYAG